MQTAAILRFILLVLLHHVPVMQDGSEGPMKAPSNGEPSQSSSSYVYPVKSLLAGIRPGPAIQYLPSIPRQSSSQAAEVITLQGLLVHQLVGTPSESMAGLEEVSPHLTPPRSHSMLYPYPSRTAIAGPSDESEEHIRNTSDPFSPITPPTDGQSSLPISFTEAGLSSTTTQVFIPGPSVPLTFPELDLLAPGGPPSDTTPAPARSTSELFASFESKSMPDLTVDHPMDDVSSGPSSDLEPVGSNVTGHFFTAGYSHGTDESGYRVAIGPESDAPVLEDEVRISQRHPHTFRLTRIFQGIRTPGAIQGFGVMVVVAEDTYAGTLAVRQVSEVPSPVYFRSVCTNSSPHRTLRTS